MIKDYASIVGMPDEADKRNIEFIIRLYESKFPGDIAERVRIEKRNEFENAGGRVSKFLIKNEESQLRKVLILPPGLDATIKDSYPTMFTDKAHFHWFVLNFPQFRVAEKISF